MTNVKRKQRKETNQKKSNKNLYQMNMPTTVNDLSVMKENVKNQLCSKQYQKNHFLYF